MKTKAHYTKTFHIPKDELERYEKLLESEGVDYAEMDIPELSTIKKWTVEFDDGCFVDIKVNSNTRADGDFYAEAVLFNKDGCQLNFTEAQYDLKGVWNLETNNAWYSVEV